MPSDKTDEVDKPTFLSDDNAQNDVMSKVKVAYVDRQQRLRTKHFRKNKQRSGSQADAARKSTQAKKSGFSFWSRSKKSTGPLAVINNDSNPSSRESLLALPRTSVSGGPASNKNSHGLAKNPDYVSDSEPEDQEAGNV